MSRHPFSVSYGFDELRVFGEGLLAYGTATLVEDGDDAFYVSTIVLEAPTASFKSVVSALIPTPPAGRIRIVGKADTGGASLGYVELDKATGNFISFTAF